MFLYLYPTAFTQVHGLGTWDIVFLFF